jgi:hypothetical protein
MNVLFTIQFESNLTKTIMQKKIVLSSLYHKICLWSCVNIFLLIFLFYFRQERELEKFC